MHVPAEPRRGLGQCHHALDPLDPAEVEQVPAYHRWRESCAGAIAGLDEVVDPADLFLRDAVLRGLRFWKSLIAMKRSMCPQAADHAGEYHSATASAERDK